MRNIDRLARVMLSTRFLLAAFALSALGVVYAAEMGERVSVEELGALKAAGLGQKCQGQVGCGPACVQPACFFKVQPNGQVVLVIVGGAAGVTNPAGKIGTCKSPGVFCSNGTPCGNSQVPACVILPNGVPVGVCANNGAPAGC